jgi:hypothetical protein
MRTLVGVLVVAGLLQGAADAHAGEGMEQCEMRVEDAGAGMFRAVYLNRFCGEAPPHWVAIDMWVEHVELETMNYPAGRRADCSDPMTCNVGWYMRPTNFGSWIPSIAGATYAIQARSDAGGGRATVYLTMDRSGAIITVGAVPPTACKIIVKATGDELRATYNSVALCGPWPPMWFSTSAQVHALPKGGGFKVKVSGPVGTHLVRAVLPGTAQGGTWVTLGPVLQDPQPIAGACEIKVKATPSVQEPGGTWVQAWYVGNCGGGRELTRWWVSPASAAVQVCAARERQQRSIPQPVSLGCPPDTGRGQYLGFVGAAGAYQVRAIGPQGDESYTVVVHVP